MQSNLTSKQSLTRQSQQKSGIKTIIMKWNQQNIQRYKIVFHFLQYALFSIDRIVFEVFYGSFYFRTNVFQDQKRNQVNDHFQLIFQSSFPWSYTDLRSNLKPKKAKFNKKLQKQQFTITNHTHKIDIQPIQSVIFQLQFQVFHVFLMLVKASH